MTVMGCSCVMHRQRRGAGGLHDVARIDQPQADLAADRRGDVAVVDLQLVELHGALIVLDRALVLQHQLLLVVDRLLRDGVACQGGAVARQIHLRLREHVLVALEHALRLQQRGAVGARIDLDQRIALREPAGLP